MYKRKDRRLFELSESLNTLSDINFHLKICMNIQFHRYNHLKYQFVCKYMKKITMEIWMDLDSFGWIWMDLDFFIEDFNSSTNCTDDFLNSMNHLIH